MITSMTVELRERATRHLEATGDPNTFKVRIISAGLGSSAYYPPEVIERDGPNVFVPGIFSFANHPTMDEEWERPERDVTKIVGKQVSTATYDPTDQSLYADFKFSEKFTNEVVKEFGDVIGMSIYALGESEIGTIGEYTGTVLTSFIKDPLTSVDAVTVAGANGAIITKVSEAYKSFSEKGTAEPQRTKQTKEKTTMDEKEMTALLEKQFGAFAEALVSKLAEALKPAPVDPEVTDMGAVTEAAIKAEIPEDGRDRVREAVKSGKKPEEAIAAEKKYVEAIEASLKARLQESGDVWGGSSAASSADFSVTGWRI